MAASLFGCSSGTPAAATGASPGLPVSPGVVESASFAAASPIARASSASTFAEFATQQCAALQALFRAYGNPDTAGLSPMMIAFEGAIDRSDSVEANKSAEAIVAELGSGRVHVRLAAGWAPAADGMSELERFLEAMTEYVKAELKASARGLTAARAAGQASFESAGGVDAWRGWLEDVGAAMRAAGATGLPACEGVPIS